MGGFGRLPGWSVARDPTENQQQNGSFAVFSEKKL